MAPASQKSELLTAAQTLSKAVHRLAFSAPVAFVYNPLDYAWEAHAAYLENYGSGRKQVIFLGMNPGPFGMAQTGVPFGEVKSVRDWMLIEKPVGHPPKVHPKKPVEGFACPRSEVSGQRLWGLFRERFGPAKAFFADHFVVNYCPLAFFDEGGRNLTPDKFPAAETAALFAACDEHLRRMVEVQKPEWLIGVGDFALKRAEQVCSGSPVKIGKILHPSPASPAANRGWAAAATAQLKKLGVWS